MIDLKTPEELEIMAQGGAKLAAILKDLLEMSQPGVSLLEIESKAQELIKKSGGTASFQTVENYQWATCLCVNDAVVHGIPTAYKLLEGDILTIDVGLLYHGLHTDTAWTKIIGSPKSKINQTSDSLLTRGFVRQEGVSELENFLQVGQTALQKGIKQAQVGNRVGHISQAIEQTIVPAGYSIVKTLVGHGVGSKLHEEPQVPGFLRGKLADTLLLQSGLTIAVEVIYAAGRGEIVYDNDDGWTIASSDGSLTAVFEETIAVTSDGPRVLTQIVG